MGDVESVQVVGLIGHPVGHSRSPQMQQAAFAALGISARYELWDTAPEHLAARVAALRDDHPGEHILGANVTIPYKTAVLPLLDAVAPEAQRHAGAVNTLVRGENAAGVTLTGHNTDVLALRRVLQEDNAWGERVDATDAPSRVRPIRRMLVLGAGGAAQAALGVGLLEGAEVWVAARRQSAALAALTALWQRQQHAMSGPYADAGAGADDAAMPSVWHARALALPNASEENGASAALRATLAITDVLINTTPVGTRDADATPLAPALLAQLPASAYVFDMVYNPPETALVRAARARGLRAVGGLPMLLYQGAEAFTLWTGRPAPLEAMRAALGLATAR